MKSSKNSNRKLTIFRPGDIIDCSSIEAWFNNLFIEINEAGYSDTDIDILHDPKNYYGKFLNPKKRLFFLEHFSRNIAKATSFLFGRNIKYPRILDLGCGCGSQSLLFALMGAEVECLDINKKVLSILRKRQIFYEKETERKLNITTHCINTLDFNYATIEPVDGIYSLFAFNMMQPSSILIAKLSEIAKTDAHLAIQDVNTASWKGRIVKHLQKSCAISPKELRAELSRNDWRIMDQQGCISILPIFWRVFPNNVLRIIDDKLSSTLFFPLSYLTLAKRKLPKGAD